MKTTKENKSLNAKLTCRNDGFIMNIESKKYHQTFSLGTLRTFAEILDIDIRELFATLDEK